MRLRVGRIYRAVNRNLDPELTWLYQVLMAIERDGHVFFVAVKLGENIGSLFLLLFDESGNEVGGENHEAIPGSPFRLFEVVPRKPSIYIEKMIWKVL